MKSDDRFALCVKCKKAWATPRNRVRIPAEGGVYQEVLLCSRCMDDFHQLMIDLKAGEVDLEDLEIFG